MTSLIVARPFLPGAAQAMQGQGGLFVILWLLVLAGVLLMSTRIGSAPWQFTKIDALFCCIFVWYTASGMVAIFQASPRPAINTLWQWLAMAASYWTVRYLLTTWYAIRALLAVMIGLAVAMAAIGLEQYFMSGETIQRTYLEAQDDVEVLWDLTGEWLPPGSAQRQRYESRLFSSEPIATFALTNSLAGFLAPWLIVLAGLGIPVIRSSLGNPVKSDPEPVSDGRTKQARGNRSPPRRRAGRSTLPSRTRADWKQIRRIFELALGAVGLILLVACLLLTKSRSGYLAVLIGFGGLGIASWAGPRCKRLVLFTALPGMILVLLIGIGSILGWLDRELWAEAGKSLGYRLQYWQASAAMIGDYPLLGCGPGQFQDTYTAYKLPAASEEIADPHNFIFELGATAGIPAALGFLVAAGLLICRRSSSRSPTAARGAAAPAGAPQEPVPPVRQPTSRRLRKRATARAVGTNSYRSEVVPVYLGGLVGLVLGPGLAWLDQLDVPIAHGVIACITTAVVVWALDGWVREGQVPTHLFPIGIVVLGIHLLAAGGIGDPAVAGTFWLLAALQIHITNGVSMPRRARLSATQSDRSPSRSAPDVDANHPDRAPKPIQPRDRGTRLAANRLVRLGMFLLVLAALFTAYWTVYVPVIRCRGYLARANDPAHRHQLDNAIRELKRAVAADRFSAVATRRLANVYFAAWRKEPAQSLLDGWIVANDRALTLAPRSARQWQTSAAGWTTIWQQSGRSEAFDRARTDIRRAIARYPNDASLHAALAGLWDLAGEHRAAQTSARRALQLDAITHEAGHRDRYLPQTLRRALEEMVVFP